MDWPEIALIGSYPPPYGGIGVHLQRLAERLEQEGVDFVLYNTVSDSQRPPRVLSIARRKRAWYLRFCLRHRCKIVHLVTVNWLSRLMFGFTARWRPAKYVLSIHGKSISEALNDAGPIRARLTHWLLQRMDAVVACNPDIARECLERVGLPRERVYMIPAFIPPDPAHAAALPEDIRGYVATHAPLLSAVGWIGKRHAGKDLYGIDMLIDLVARLQRPYPNIGLILCVNGGPPDQVDAAVETTRSRVGDHLLMVTEPLDDVSRLFQASQLFVRPTNTDGDAVSIREALHLGVPVVTSDAVPRPEPCVLFRTRDLDDFERQVRSALSDLPALRARVAACKMPDNAVPIMQLYEELGDQRSCRGATGKSW
jgi:glycosyltransferase involved in cell wall biosynthesis